MKLVFFRLIPFRASELNLPWTSESLGMSTFFRGITVPSLFRGIFLKRNSIPNPSHEAGGVAPSSCTTTLYSIIQIIYVAWLFLTTFTNTLPRYLLHSENIYSYIHTVINYSYILILYISLHSPFLVIWVNIVSTLCWEDKSQIYFYTYFYTGFILQNFWLYAFIQEFVLGHLGYVKTILQNSIQGSE